jgi:hypothetical protein
LLYFISLPHFYYIPSILCLSFLRRKRRDPTKSAASFFHYWFREFWRKMGTRSNLYKNPSITYNKHFSLSSVLQNLHGLFSNLSLPYSLIPIPTLSLTHQSSILQLTTSPPAMLLPTTNRLPLPPSPTNVAVLSGHSNLITITKRMKLTMILHLCPTTITF